MQKRWIVVLILFYAQVVNFVDKAVMGIAAVPIMHELGLSPARYGLIASGLYSLYAASGLVVAIVFASRVPPRVILLVLLVVWSTAQLPILFAASFGVLLGCRTVLGAAEGPATPAMVSATHEWFPTEERSLPTALVLFGTTIGPLLGAPLLSYVIAGFGWRAAFLVCSVLGFSVLLFWWRFGADGPEAATGQGVADASPASVGTARIWREPTIIGSLLGGFCAYWSIGFAVSWLAPYLRIGLGYDTVTTGWLLSLIFIGQGMLGLGITAASHHLTRRGVSSRRAHAWFIGAVQAGSAVAFAATALVDAAGLKVLLLLVALGLPGVTFILGPSIVSEVTPTEHRNRTLGIILSLVTVSGMIAPYVSGVLIGAGKGASGYDDALLLAGGVLLIGAVISFTLLHPNRARRRLAGP